MAKRDNIKHFISSRKGQIIFNYLYSWGAAVVIIGAMFKIIHLPFADYILMAGMITEAIVFFISAFDYISPTPATETPANAGVFVGSSVTGGTVVAPPGAARASTESGKGKVEGSGSVVIIGGGGNAGSGSYAGSSGMSNAQGSGGTSVGSPSVASGNTAGGSKNVSPEYAQSLNDTAQNLEEFSTTIQSLNEASQKLLGAYKHVTETQGFVDNLATLNENVSGLNDVFNTQLQTINEQMSAIRYINDSLIRMKGLYDGAIGDSYMFREESAKMTKHIEALNNVYARLLQAMTTNNNNNMNPTNF
ncbi:gliding motility protein GldL [Prevotella sp. 10(H)]|uniref:type IX secretion system motor protein PorL/GldL n=1 Tax=Prevotella sp. 10(H) TaxID=1158294 RepID=UPI0004A73E3C|nr:gliding motility protein GldL [Prevotella sp. 10(H)]